MSDGKLPNFVMDYLFLLIENQSQVSNKKVFTVNSDVYKNMTHFSMNPHYKGSTVMTPYARNIVSCLIFGSLDSVIND